MVNRRRKNTRPTYIPLHNKLGTFPDPLPVTHKFRIIADMVCSRRSRFPIYLLSREKCHPLRERDAGLMSRLLAMDPELEYPLSLRMVRYTTHKGTDWNRELWEMAGIQVIPLSQVQLQEVIQEDES